VELGVEDPAGAVDVGGDQQTVAVELEHPTLAGPGEGGVVLQVGHRGCHRRVVSGSHRLAVTTVTESPQQRDRLGC